MLEVRHAQTRHKAQQYERNDDQQELGVISIIQFVVCLVGFLTFIEDQASL